MTTKQEILRMLAKLPEDATIDDAMESLYLMLKIENGIQQAEAGEGYTKEEARERMKRWLA